MPHKRAKRSVREKLKAEKKSDLPPIQGLPDDMPKSMARILNAEVVQKAWRERKRVLSEIEGDVVKGENQKKRKAGGTESSRSKQNELKIKPGESLRHFNERVEDDMRPLVRTAMKNTTSVSKQKVKASERGTAQASLVSTNNHLNDDSDGDDGSLSQAPRGKALQKDFARTCSSTPKRLNDIVRAPPELKVAPRLRRLAAAAQSKDEKRSTGSGSSEGDVGNDVVSAAQKRMMELEREKAVRRYRALKEAKMKRLRAGQQDVQ